MMDKRTAKENPQHKRTLNMTVLWPVYYSTAISLSVFSSLPIWVTLASNSMYCSISECSRSTYDVPQGPPLPLPLCVS